MTDFEPLELVHAVRFDSVTGKKMDPVLGIVIGTSEMEEGRLATKSAKWIIYRILWVYEGQLSIDWFSSLYIHKIGD